MEFPRSHRGLTILPRWETNKGQTNRTHPAGGEGLSDSRVCPVTHLVKRPDCRSGETSSILVQGAMSPRSSAEECLASNQGVGSSNLSEGSIFLMRDSSVVEHLAHNQAAGGSIPPPATNHQGERRILAVRGRREGGKDYAEFTVSHCLGGSTYPDVAQLAEHPIDNREVGGSNPPVWTSARVAQLVESNCPTSRRSAVRFRPWAPNNS